MVQAFVERAQRVVAALYREAKWSGISRKEVLILEVSHEGRVALWNSVTACGAFANRRGFAKCESWNDIAYGWPVVGVYSRKVGSRVPLPPLPTGNVTF